MKKLIYSFGILILVIASCSETQESTQSAVKLGKNYGPFKIDTTGALSVEAMMKDYGSGSADKTYTFKGTINEVCSKAGCWVNIDKGNGETFMVRFKDHFTIPVKTNVGTEAFLHGVMYRDTITVEMLRHFAEDAGKTAEEIEKITEPEFEVGFEADGIVLIEPNKSAEKK